MMQYKDNPQIGQIDADKTASENYLRKSATSAESYNPDVLSCIANMSVMVGSKASFM